jgi:ubiquitin C-terminal hydrolase
MNEPSLNISIQVKNKTSIQEGLHEYFKEEALEGANSYSCEKCDKKVAAHKKVLIK